MTESSPDSSPDDSPANMADMIVRYDLAQMKAELKNEFTADSGSHRLLRQADISKRFKRRRPLRKPKSGDDS